MFSLKKTVVHWVGSNKSVQGLVSTQDVKFIGCISGYIYIVEIQ
jgi:hypothetical protein